MEENMKKFVLLIAVAILFLGGCAMDLQQRQGYAPYAPRARTYSSVCGGLTPQECRERAQAVRSVVEVEERIRQNEMRAAYDEENLRRMEQERFRRSINIFGGDLPRGIRNWNRINR